MTVRVEEQRLGELRWIVLRGPSAEAFGALGQHMRAEIREILTDWPQLTQLRRHVAGSRASQRLAAVRQASEAAFPQVCAELAALADGAGVPLGDLALLNFRGDLGAIDCDPAGDGIGCSDLAWRRRSVIAHNEDDSEFFDGRCAMLRLALEGQQPVTTFWKPVFLPSNTVAVTGAGMVWSIDHLPVALPGAGAGRHFVARGLQREAATIDQAVDYLRRHSSAGGYAYTIGDRAGRVISVESVAGQHACREVGGQWPAGLAYQSRAIPDWRRCQPWRDQPVPWPGAAGP
jgi:Acyl-coenzyme A:6-aminopenicillanic acid acyl-transferase